MVQAVVPGLSPPRFGFDPRSAHVRFVVNRLLLGQVNLWVLQLRSVRIILRMLYLPVTG